MIVLDASALLALLHRETGWEVVAGAAVTESATLSAVNYAEVVQKAAQHGLAAEDVDAALEALDVTVSPFGRLDARLAASFYRHRSNLSLGDRVCLALARSLSSPAFTADRAWQRWGRSSEWTSASSAEGVASRPAGRHLLSAKSADSPQDVRKRPLLVVNDQRHRSMKQQVRRR